MNCPFKSAHKLSDLGIIQDNEANCKRFRNSVWFGLLVALYYFSKPFSLEEEGNIAAHINYLTKCILSWQKRKDAFQKSLSVFQQNLLGRYVGTSQRLSVGQVPVSEHFG